MSPALQGTRLSSFRLITSHISVIFLVLFTYAELGEDGGEDVLCDVSAEDFAEAEEAGAHFKG